MQIEVKGRGVTVTDEVREHVTKRFRRVDAQVSELARLEVELCEERNPAIRDGCIVEAKLALKGTTLVCSARGRSFEHAINHLEDELSRQVKRHRDKRRNHRKIGTETIRTAPPAVGEQPAL